jgi:hypothetical protein
MAFTAASKEEVEEAVYNSKMNDIIFKPFDLNSFLETVEKHLKK